MVPGFGFLGRFYRVVAALPVVLGVVLPVQADQVPVVASFSILGEMVKQVGGNRVSVTTLVGPDGDTHVYIPTPADARAVTNARVLVVNGLGFEGWMERLLEAADFKGVLVTATDGVDAIEFEEGGEHHDEHKDHADEESDKHGHDDGHEKDHDEDKDDHDGHKKAHKDDHDEHKDDHDGHDHGEFDPHAWQALANAKIYSQNIERGLATADPANAGFYQKRLASYVSQIEALDTAIKDSMAQLPIDRRTVVTSHDAFQYFGRAYGLIFLAPQGLSTESEASAEDVAKLIKQIRAEKIKAVFVENLSDSRLIERIAEETGASVGGTLYPGALSPTDGPAATYLDMLRTNARVIRGALSQ